MVSTAPKAATSWPTPNPRSDSPWHSHHSVPRQPVRRARRVRRKYFAGCLGIFGMAT